MAQPEQERESRMCMWGRWNSHLIPRTGPKAAEESSRIQRNYRTTTSDDAVNKVCRAKQDFVSGSGFWNSHSSNWKVLLGNKRLSCYRPLILLLPGWHTEWRPGSCSLGESKDRLWVGNRIESILFDGNLFGTMELNICLSLHFREALHIRNPEKNELIMSRNK